MSDTTEVQRGGPQNLSGSPQAEERPPLAMAGGEVPIPSRGRRLAPGQNVDVYCETCFAPAHVTDRGNLCDEHYDDDRPPCEICGLRAAAALHNGYLQCGVCINTGASYA
jgi:hypothetical protein